MDTRTVRKWIRLAIKAVLKQEAVFEWMNQRDIEPVFSVLLTDNAGIRKYNADFRGIDLSTDVLSFPGIAADERILKKIPALEIQYNREGGKEVLLGDIIISTERATEQAFEIGNPVEQEICFLTVHSVLHLIGYDHMAPEEEAVMIVQQKKAIESIYKTLKKSEGAQWVI